MTDPTPSHFTAPTPEHVCSKCNRPRPAANLTLLESGKRWCPECLYRKESSDWQHQVLSVAAPPPAAEHGLTVADVPTHRRRGAA